MAQIDITKMSSKGQIVIPQELRKGINEGDKLLVIRSKDQIILKKADKFDKALQEDLEFARKSNSWFFGRSEFGNPASKLFVVTGMS